MTYFVENFSRLAEFVQTSGVSVNLHIILQHSVELVIFQFAAVVLEPQILGVLADWCCVVLSCITDVTPVTCFNLTSLSLGRYIYEIATLYVLFNILQLGFN